jgi:hypothetical protein
MRLHDRFVGALLALVLVTGCGGAVPESDSAPVSVPMAPAAPAPNPDQPVSSAPAPGAGQHPTPPTPPQKPVTTAPGATGGGAPANPGVTAPTPPGPVAAPPTGAITPANPGTAQSPPAAPADPVVATPATGQALAFTSVQRGAYSGVTERKAVLISDEVGWRSNWQQLTARQVPAPEAPAMDFSQHSVLAVYMGEKNSGGYAVEITGVEVAGGKLKVTVRQTSPGPGAMVTQALTQPFHMVRIPKVPDGTPVEVNWQ